METFDYAAISKDGVRSKGSLAAPNAREARDILRGRGLSLLQIKKPARSRVRDGAMRVKSPIRIERSRRAKWRSCSTRRLPSKKL